MALVGYSTSLGLPQNVHPNLVVYNEATRRTIGCHVRTVGVWVDGMDALAVKSASAFAKQFLHWIILHLAMTWCSFEQHFCVR